MLNLIGAVLITVLLFKIVIERPSLKDTEEKFYDLPLWGHIVFLLYLTLLALCEGFQLFSSVLAIGVPNMLLSGFTLWVHEAGHIYFCWGGTVIHSLGGTLNELLFALVPAVICFRRRYVLLTALFLYWAGHNLFGISRYIGDARARVLPLFGSGTHDWYTILGRLGLLNYDRMIAGIVFILACITLLFSILYYIYWLFKPQASSEI